MGLDNVEMKHTNPMYQPVGDLVQEELLLLPDNPRLLQTGTAERCRITSKPFFETELWNFYETEITFLWV